ncbi:MAG: hypothetical protein PHS82_06220 [Lachnospiraceae bacterium]|nr:hypothetical protein [Lachnospiraceae bacterium]
MYRVVKFFTDLHDNEHPYNVGDEYPREGVEVTTDRVNELSGSDNAQHVPLIEEVVEEDVQDPAEALMEPVKEVRKTTRKSGAKTSEK